MPNKLNMIISGNKNSSYSVRYEELDGRQYMVVPVTMSVPGVHHGSGGPALYTEELLSSLPDAWNGRVVVLYHPQDNAGNMISANSPEVVKDRAVGTIYNAQYNGGLKAEAYIDVEKIKEVSPETYQAIANGNIIGVSIGAYEVRENTQGEYEGESYESVVIDIVPDHLALLLNEVGACSVEDGCGIRANQQGKEVMCLNEDEKEKQSAISSFVSAMKKKLAGIFTGSLSDIDVRDLLTLALQSSTAGESYVHVLEVYPDSFVYEIEENGAYTLYRVGYAIVDGKVVLGDERQPVRKTVEYVPIVNSIGKPKIVPQISYEQIEKGERDGMNKKAIIDNLISNQQVTGYGEDTRPFLEGLTECQLGKINDLAQKAIQANEANQTQETETEGNDSPEGQQGDSEQVNQQAVSVEQSVQSNQQTTQVPALTTEQFMQLVPEPVRNALGLVMNQAQSQKASSVSNILKADPSFKKEELELMSNETLVKVERSLAGGTFVGNAGGARVGTDDGYAPAEKLWSDLP